MEEIEVKILDINRKELEKKLISLGAKKIFEGEIYASFFDYKDNSIRKKNNTMRLRKEGNKTVLTYKKPVKHESIKIRKEYETEVSDFKTAKKILESLGLKEWKILKKRRISYKLNNVRFEFDKHIDQYSYVPEFLEIEAKSIEDIYKYAKLLGYKEEDCKPWTIMNLEKYYSKK